MGTALRHDQVKAISLTGNHLRYRPVRPRGCSSLTMRIWLCIGILIASTVNAYATVVPEIGAELRHLLSQRAVWTDKSSSLSS